MPFDSFRSDWQFHDVLREQDSNFIAMTQPSAATVLSIPVERDEFYQIDFGLAEHTVSVCACGGSHDYALLEAKALAFELATTRFEGLNPPGFSEKPVYADEIPDNTSTTATLAVGGSVTSETDTVGDRDWFRIELVAGQRYTFTLNGSGTTPLNDPWLKLRNQSGTEIAANDDAGNSLNSRLSFTATASGTYYLDAGSFSSSTQPGTTGTYTLAAETAPPLAERTFDGIANFLTSEYWEPRRWQPGINITYNVDSLSAGAQILAVRALEAWAEVTGLIFTASSGISQITFQNTESGAFASTTLGATLNGYRSITRATINVSADWNGENLSLDSYTYQTFLHEVGHAIGLGHGGPYNSTADYGIDNVYLNDAWNYTVMSYFDQSEASYGSFRHVLGPQIADLIAVQNLYGADPAGTRAGNTTYGFNSTETDVNNWAQFTTTVTNSTNPASPNGTYLRPPSYAIYDTGGIDTIDLSGYASGQTLNLNPETFSSLGFRPAAGEPVYRNVVSIARGTIIENAIGGSGNDFVTGNSANNRITLGAGNDTFIYLSGGGNDTITDFSISADRIDLRSLSQGQQTAAISSVRASGSDTIIDVAGGTVTLLNVASTTVTASIFQTSGSNRAPIAFDDRFILGTVGTSYTGNVLNNNGNGADSDPDSDPLTVTAINGAPVGTGVTAFTLGTGAILTLSRNGAFTVTFGNAQNALAFGQTLTDSINYTLSDGQGGATTGVLAFTYRGGGNAPTESGDTLAGTRNGDVINALGGNDQILPDLGGDAVDGGAGTDTVIYNFARATAGIVSFQNYVHVTAGNGQGIDNLTNVEVLRFNGTDVAVSSLPEWRPMDYIASNGDLLTIFGPNIGQAINHYLRFGFFEGRAVDTFGEYQYLASNLDLVPVYGTNNTGVAVHYVAYGFAEGRQTKSFDAVGYLASNTSVLSQFGGNTELASKHYIETGRAAGLQTNTFDALRYIASNGDLILAFRLNATAGRDHFVFSGFSEGRSATQFNPAQYLAANGDLQAAFGSNLVLATRHYIQFGFDEGRRIAPSAEAPDEKSGSVFAKDGASDGGMVANDLLVLVDDDTFDFQAALTGMKPGSDLKPVNEPAYAWEIDSGSMAFNAHGVFDLVASAPLETPFTTLQDGSEPGVTAPISHDGDLWLFS